MRKIINSTYVTLDGVIEDPQDWPSLGGFTDQGHQVQRELLERCDAVLMGRHTYDGFAPVWSALSGDPFSDRMNALPKYVVSTTLTDPQWNNTTVIDHDPHRGRPRPQAAAGRRHRAVRLRPTLPRAHGGRAARRAAAVGAPLLRRRRHGRRPALPRRRRPGRFELADATTLDSGIVILTLPGHSRHGGLTMGAPGVDYDGLVKRLECAGGLDRTHRTDPRGHPGHRAHATTSCATTSEASTPAST